MQGQHLPVFLGDGVELPGQLFFQVLVPGNAQQGGAGTAQTEGRTGGAHQRFDLFVIRNQKAAIDAYYEQYGA